MKTVVIGLGRIGLPLALVTADSGIIVTGIDIKEELISMLKNKEEPFYEPMLKELLEKHLNKNFYPKLQDEATDDIRDAEYIIITIGTEFVKYPQKPNIGRLFSIIENILTVGIEGKTIILRVTMPVGYTDKIKEKIESNGLKEGVDFYLAFVPERIMEGKAIEEEKTLPKIIGCYNDSSFQKVKLFFSKIGGEIIQVTNPKTAEFIKLIDNAWRNTRFAFSNELAFLAEKNGIDVIEAISSANESYKRNQIPVPGPVSGYCLGKDPYILEDAFKEVSQKRGFNSVWFYGRMANDWLIEKVIEYVGGGAVLVAGLTFKADIDDFRYSHGIEIVKRMIEDRKKVYVHDPYLDKNMYTKIPTEIEDKVKKIFSFSSIPEEVETIIFSVPHREYKKIKISDLTPSFKIIDLWNIFRNQIQITKGANTRYVALGWEGYYESR